ncbi:hypothetical protein F5878DRAFT_645810 [Lentinula raphanica]|uniref:CxC2-like cysteine cluster KDZ transposase-associated domain-containing protein n=1 Tax=Lentinula raphanica TaxID=153919 RepID=A0AA38NZP0_9AGAR|nr:hypothetical protein F5878DRAFT_645810 [Lentinula raphanica]
MFKLRKTYQKVSFGSLFSTPVHMDELSEDGRRIKRKATNALVPSPVNKKQRETSPGLDFVTSILDNYCNDDHIFVPDSSQVINVADLLTAAAVKARRRYLTSDQPLLEWRAHADEYLGEMIRNEGRGDCDLEICYLCKQKGKKHVPLFRCMECFSEDLVCEACCKLKHEDRPLDVVEKWNGKFFEKVALRDIGVTVQLGHRAGETCFNLKIVHDFTVIHTNGVHTVDLSYCNCPNRTVAGEWNQQLLRRRWFPATHLEPRTAATYRVLEMFHVLTLQGKVTTYDFYAGLEKLTDNTGVRNIKDRYKAFSRMMKEWRHLKMPKRAGRGNDASRTLAETRAGEMGIPCIACPRPGINLPDDWKEAPASKSYLYWIYFAIDACFRLKRCLVSSEKQDPDLDVGGSYFTEDSLFRQYLASVTDQQEMSTCTGLSALDHANTKFSRGYATTGVGLGVCARHEFIQRNGVVDLQKGERYANMDYAFGSFLRHHDPALTKVVSYDIACQWHKNLVKLFTKSSSPYLNFIFTAINCLVNFLSLSIGYGELDERMEKVLNVHGLIWDRLPPVRDMGPGSRHGTMNDHFGHWNWVKLIGIGSLLHKQYRIAVEEMNTQRESLKEFTEGKGPDTLKWEAMIKDWEVELEKPEKDRNKSVVNPYDIPKTGPTAFMSQLLELEDQQRVLRLDIKDKSFETALQKTELTERRTKLLRLMGRLRSIQALYMPAAITYLSNRQVDHDQVEHVEYIPVVFPSTLPAADRISGCRTGLVSIEEQLREAQLRAALNSLRNHLHMKFRLLTYRKTNRCEEVSFRMEVSGESSGYREQRQLIL